MNENYLSELELLLSKNQDYVVEDKVNKNKVAELAHKYDPELIDLLAGNKGMRRLFFVETNKDVLVFNKDKFIQFISNKEFLPDSYTSYKNKIGLGTGTELLSENKEVVLNWAYKDTVLEGGQDKEDVKRDEVFHNEVLAPDQIDRLLDEKVLTGWKKFDKGGEHEAKEITDNDNLIIRGNNLLALYSLKKRYAGKIKLIYIDPPYNTGNDGFNYNDRFNHSSWLTFMKNRLEVARELLSDDGLIYVNIDNNEAHYLKVLMDEVFGRDNFSNDIVWHYSGWNKKLKAGFERRYDDILLYAKNKNATRFNSYFEQWESEEEYIRKRKQKALVDEDGRKYVMSDAGNGKRVKRYVEEAIKEGVVVDDVWHIDKINNSAKESEDFSGQKPEVLLERIVASATDEGDIVLDYHLGSGTTASVAHKMKRRWIGIEQMSYVEDTVIERIKKVIAGEQGGISKTVGWQGGGGFVYAQLMDLGNKFIDKVKNASTDKELVELLEQAKKSSFLSYKVDPEKINPGDKDFASLSIAHKKQLLLEVVDHNHLYVNYTEINDADYGVSAEDKKLNKQFYGK